MNIRKVVWISVGCLVALAAAGAAIGVGVAQKRKGMTGDKETETEPRAVCKTPMGKVMVHVVDTTGL